MRKEPKPLPNGFLGLEAIQIAPKEEAWLGLEVVSNDSGSLESLEFQPGVRVVKVDPSGPSAEKGIVVGDILLKLEGTPVDDPGRLEALLSAIGGSRVVLLELQRGSEVLEAEVTARVRKSVRPRTKYFIDRALFRVAFEDTDSAHSFPRIAMIDTSSPFAAVDVHVGDTIRLFEGHDPGSARELVKRIRHEISPGDTVSFLVEKGDGSRKAVTVNAWEPERELISFSLWPLISWNWDRSERREKLIIGNLFFTSVFRVEQIGGVHKWSIFSLIAWETGEARLETIEGE